MPYRKPPWQAKVYFEGKQHWLGAYETYEEALAVEDRFRIERGVSTDPAERERQRVKRAHTTLSVMGTYRNRYTVKA